MYNLKEFREHPDRLSDVLPWVGLVSEGVVLNKDGSFQKSFRFRGLDLNSATREELTVLSLRVNNILKRLGGGWVLYTEARRKKSSEYPESVFREPVSFLIDEERRALFSGIKHFETEYFMTLQYLPPGEGKSKLNSMFLETKEKGVSYEKYLTQFEGEVKNIKALFETTLKEVKFLSDSETLSYLHSTVSEKDHPVKVPETPVYLDAMLSDTPLIGGLKPRLGKLHLGAIRFLSFPPESYSMILDELNHLSIEYRFVSRFISLDKLEAQKEAGKLRLKFFDKRKGIKIMLREALSKKESGMMDEASVKNEQEAASAEASVSGDEVGLGYFTPVIILYNKDETALEQDLGSVEKVINSLGFVTKREELNAVSAFLGSIPGNPRSNVTRPLISTLNLSHILPLSAVWAGPEKNRHLNAPPLFYSLTGGSTAFRFSNHVGDVGHTLVVGPTGSGKSVLLNFMEAQFLRYENAEVYVFDKGGSSRVLSYGVGGEFFELGSSSSLSFQPLKDIDSQDERKFAHEWVINIFSREGVKITPEVKDLCYEALISLSSSPKSERTLTGLMFLLQNEELRKAIKPYTLEGPHGTLLDSSNESLSFSSFQVFEMERLMETKSAVLPVLEYLFHRLEKRFTGAPTLLVLDEAWLFLDTPEFSQKIREWLKVLRKANVSVIFATQSLSDIAESSISSTLKEACPTKVYLPNPNALTESGKEFYRAFGLNSRQTEIIAQSTPKRHYYLSSSEGNRLFELGLGAFQLAYTARTSKEDQKKAKSFYKESETAREFNLRWLEELGLYDEKDVFTEVTEKKEAA